MWSDIVNFNLLHSVLVALCHSDFWQCFLQQCESKDWLVWLYQILAPALAKNQPFLQIQLWPKFAKWHIQILQCSVFQLVSKNCAVDVAVFSIRLFILLRSCHHLPTYEISCYEYPLSLSSFVYKSQIRPWPQLGHICVVKSGSARFTKPESCTTLVFGIINTPCRAQKL